MALLLNAQLGSLTRNNVPLIKKLRASGAFTSNPIELIKNGFYQAENWDSIITDQEIPDTIEGDTASDKKTNYINEIIANLEFNYPTAILAEKIKSNQIRLADQPLVREEIYDVLSTGSFELGKMSINQHLNSPQIVDLNISDTTKSELKKTSPHYTISSN